MLPNKQTSNFTHPQT